MTINIAVIGCGNWGKNHIRVLSELGNLFAISDSIVSQAAPYLSQYSIPFYTIEEILAHPMIHAVVIATPAHTHFELAQRCLAANKAVFIEKPLTLTVREAEQLDRQAQQQHLCLMSGHLLHYHPAFIKMKTLHAQHTLGKLQYIYSNRLNLGKFRTEEDVWWSFAPHDVSMILGLTHEMPIEVTANQANYLTHTQADICTAHMKFPSGAQAHIFVSWLHPYKEQKLVIIYEKSMFIFDDSQKWDEKLKHYPYPDSWQDGLPSPCTSQAENIPLNASEPLKNQMQHFIDCIQKKTSPITNGAEAIRVLTVLTQAKLAMHNVSLSNKHDLKQDLKQTEWSL